MNVKIRKLGNGITNVIINDPKTYNSLSFKTLRELLNAFTRLDKDDDTRVIILVVLRKFMKHLKVANLQIVIILITKAALSLKVW